MSKDFYNPALALKDQYGWDTKEWARRTGIVQRILESVENGKYPDDEEILDMLVSATKDGRKVKTSNLLRFKAPVVIGACLHKGGSGKTTCLVNIADDLSNRGYNVLFIDSDGQMNATSTLLPGETKPAYNLFSAISSEADIRGFIQETEHERLDIVPGSTRMGSAEAVLNSQSPHGITPDMVFKTILAEAIEENYYDFILVDMDKMVGTLNRSILTGCTHMLVVSECASYSSDGISDVYSFYNQVKATSNPDLSFLGILLNKVVPRKKVVKVMMENLDEIFPGKRFNTYIRMDANVEQSQWEGQTLREYNSRSNAWKDISAVTDELIERVKPLAV